MVSVLDEVVEITRIARLEKKEKFRVEREERDYIAFYSHIGTIEELRENAKNYVISTLPAIKSVARLGYDNDIIRDSEFPRNGIPKIFIIYAYERMGFQAQGETNHGKYSTNGGDPIPYTSEIFRISWKK